MSGEKIFEFRKTRLSKDKIGKIYIYSTAPVKKIIARIVIEDILEDSPDALWNRCKSKSGISEEEFFNYFSEKDIAFAIQIKKVEKLKKPIDPYKKLENFAPPQSYYYLRDGVLT
jgi:type I restriction enzyme S subunit